MTLDIHKAAEEFEQQQEAVAEEVEEAVETEEQEESVEEEFEIVLESEEEEKPQQEEFDSKALVHKLTKQRKRAQKAEQASEEKDSRIEELERQVAQLSQAPAAQPQQPRFTVGSNAPIPPDRYDPKYAGNEVAFGNDYAAYQRDWNDWQQAQIAPVQQAEKQEQALLKLHQDNAEKLVSDAKEFAQSSKVSYNRLEEAILNVQDEIDAVTGVEGGFNMVASRLYNGGGAKLAFILNNPKNIRVKNELIQALQTDPTGLSAMSYATDVLAQAGGRGKKKISNAPAPDEPIRGDGSAAGGSSDLQKRYDEASKKGEVGELRKIKKEARERGVALN